MLFDSDMAKHNTPYVIAFGNAHQIRFAYLVHNILRSSTEIAKQTRRRRLC